MRKPKEKIKDEAGSDDSSKNLKLSIDMCSLLSIVDFSRSPLSGVVRPETRL